MTSHTDTPAKYRTAQDLAQDLETYGLGKVETTGKKGQPDWSALFRTAEGVPLTIYSGHVTGMPGSHIRITACVESVSPSGGPRVRRVYRRMSVRRDRPTAAIAQEIERKLVDGWEAAQLSERAAEDQAKADAAARDAAAEELGEVFGGEVRERYQGEPTIHVYGAADPTGRSLYGEVRPNHTGTHVEINLRGVPYATALAIGRAIREATNA